MINLDDVTKENIKQLNPNQHQILDHPCRMLIIEGSGTGKKSLFNLMSQQPHIGNIYLYAKDLYEAKQQFLIKATRNYRILMILKLLLKAQ